MSEVTDAMKGQMIVDAQLLDCCGEVSKWGADYGLLLTLGNGRVFSLMARTFCGDYELQIEEVLEGE